MQLVPNLLATEQGECRHGLQMSAGIRDEAARHNNILDRVKGSMHGADDMLRSSVNKFNKVRGTHMSTFQTLYFLGLCCIMHKHQAHCLHACRCSPQQRIAF
jgi:hypothetical protein